MLATATSLLGSIKYGAVSYTHLTLPTILRVYVSVVAVSLKKKQKYYLTFSFITPSSPIHHHLP
ncbi:hypothetical protein LKL48_16210, partial [Listeria monocytogenes]